MKIKDFLNQKTKDITPLLCFVLNKNQTFLYTHPETALTSAQEKKIQTFIEKRKNGVPFAYLVGYKDFYHLRFKVNQHTLIPRPETEILIDISLDLLKNNQKNNPKILDLGTGSGIIAITLKSKKPHCLVIAVDFSENALIVAKQNAQNTLDNDCEVEFLHSDWFENVTEKFDLIISNPPYIESKDKHLQHLSDPIMALVSADNGFQDIKKIIKNAPDFLNKNGFLLLEHGYNQQSQIVKLLDKNFKNIQTFKDLNGNDRCVLAMY